MTIIISVIIIITSISVIRTKQSSLALVDAEREGAGNQQQRSASKSFLVKTKSAFQEDFIPFSVEFPSEVELIGQKSRLGVC